MIVCENDYPSDRLIEQKAKNRELTATAFFNLDTKSSTQQDEELK